ITLQPHSHYGKYGLGGRAGERPKVSFAPSVKQSIGA
ncbi:unnamed protein product, partial [marine sediment metagenome]